MGGLFGRQRPGSAVGICVFLRSDGACGRCILHVPVCVTFDRFVDCLPSKFWACQLESTTYAEGLASITTRVSFGGDVLIHSVCGSCESFQWWCQTGFGGLKTSHYCHSYPVYGLVADGWSSFEDDAQGLRIHLTPPLDHPLDPEPP